MTNRKQLDKIVDKALSVSFKNGRLEVSIINRLVKDFKNMHLSDAIYTLSNYLKGLKRIISQYTLEIEAVIPLSGGQMSKIKKKIGKLFTIRQTKVTINPAILGGLRIRVGDSVLDYSVRNKLNQISEAILNG